MLNDEICKLRDKLNKSIEDGEDYAIIYKLSVELDELIAQYYKKNSGGKENKNKMENIYSNNESSKCEDSNNKSNNNAVFNDEKINRGNIVGNNSQVNIVHKGDCKK